MKDPEFIELLNLYLDHEISAADAARLEAEVRANPDRRRRYEQYCRMQKACQLLTHDFRASSPPAASRKVIDFESSARSRASRRYAIGAFAAAAACVAVILVGRRTGNEGTLNGAATVAAASPSPAAAASIRPAAAGLVSAPLSLSGQAGAVLVSASDAPAQPELDWMRNFQLSPLAAPVAAETLRFDLRPASLQPSPTPPVVRSPRTQEAAAEMTAFRFQR